jgi:hypothetical protein
MTAQEALEAIQNARLEWAMVCQCTCSACDKFYETISDIEDALAVTVPETKAEPAPEMMRITYEMVGRCLWHGDCDKSPSGIMREERRDADRTLVRYLHCGRAGYFPVGATSVYVTVESREEVETSCELPKPIQPGDPNDARSDPAKVQLPSKCCKCGKVEWYDKPQQGVYFCSYACT